MAHTATHAPLATAIVYHAPLMDDVLGVGGFARVIKRGECAVKVVFPEFRTQADREFHLLRRLVGGAHIIRVLGLRHFPDRAEITMQDGGRCLLDLIPLPKRVRRPLFAQLVAAVEEVATEAVPHRTDISSRLHMWSHWRYPHILWTGNVAKNTWKHTKGGLQGEMTRHQNDSN